MNQIDFESLSLRVLSAYYQNDFKRISRHCAEFVLVTTPECPAKDFRLARLKRTLFFPDPAHAYAVRSAGEAVISQHGPVCSTIVDYVLDHYQLHILVGQISLTAVLSWINSVCEGKEKSSVWTLTSLSILPGPPLDKVKNERQAGKRVHKVSEERAKYAVSRQVVIPIQAVDSTVHFMDLDEIYWAESDRRHCVIHTRSGVICANATLGQMANGNLSCLYRPHNSFLINPRYVHRIHQQEILLIDGTIIPVPERRFAKVQKDLLDF